MNGDGGNGDVQEPDRAEKAPGTPDIDFDALSMAVRKAAKLAGELRKDYPTSKPYLVLTIKGAYVNADSPLEPMLREIPGLFVSNDAKTAILKHLQKTAPSGLHKKGDEDKLKRWVAAWKRKFEELSTGLRLVPESLFEIRFDHLDYAEIWRLQKDDRVDAVRTPQTRASIRIVLGSLLDFASKDGKGILNAAQSA